MSDTGNVNDLSTSLGALVGMVMGGPGGALAGGLFGNLMSGGTLQSAMESGIGSLLTSGVGGKAGLAMNLLGNLGGGSSSQQRGSNFLNMFSQASGSNQPTRQTMGPRPNQMMANLVGSGGSLDGLQEGIGGLFGHMFPGVTGQSLMQALAMQLAFPKDNPMTSLQQEQFRTGERNPSYRGTPVIFNQGGLIRGPGTGTSDSIPATIYQNGGPVRKAKLSDGEFVMTADAVRGAGKGNRAAGAANMYKMMDRFERMA